MYRMDKALVLLVDDNLKNLQVLGTLLEGKYRTAIATNGANALEFVKRRRPDLILLDIMMPEINGFEVCTAIKSSPKTQSIPIIFLTAKTETEDIVRGFECGAVDYITKPFSKEELLARVNTHIKLKLSELALKAALRDYKAAKEAAEESSQAKSNFLASMSHEIRTPMNAIIGMTEMTLQTRLDKEQKDNLEIIRESSNHLLHIINDILDLSKIEAGKIRIEAVDFDLGEILNFAIRSFVYQAEKKDLYIKLEQDISTPQYLLGDPFRLRQILINLIGNALKFTEKGGITVKVTHLKENSPLLDVVDPLSKEEVMLLFSVNDTGIGIPDDKQDRIFESFSQADDSTSRKYGGSGLGLAICKQLVELMGGKIGLKSEMGIGSEFYFTVRFKHGDKDKISEVPKDYKIKENTASPLKILMVEDNPMNIVVGNNMLKRLGHAFKTVKNGKKSIEYLRKENFDLVLMDLEMPGMDGFEATKRIRAGEAGERNTRIPIIAMTAHVMSEYQTRCEEAGLNDSVIKPIDFFELNAVIKRNTQNINKVLPAPSKARITERRIVMNHKKALRQLGGNQDILIKIHRMFPELCKDFSQNVKQAINQNDLKRIAFEAHALKTPCATIGAETCEKFAAQLEKVANEERSEFIQPLLAKLEKELKKVMLMIDKRNKKEI